MTDQHQAQNAEAQTLDQSRTVGAQNREFSSVGGPAGSIRDRLLAIKARSEKATEGPWRSMSKGNDTMENGLLAAVAEVEGLPRPWNPVWFLRQEDADFIAHAREDIPFLLAEIERLREAAEALSPQPSTTNDVIRDGSALPSSSGVATAGTDAGGSEQ